MRDELELLRMSKECNSTPDGSSCSVNGAWNSEQIGLKFELATSLTDDKLNVKLSDKAPKKMTAYKIDSSWNCSGLAVHSIGGPLLLFCSKLPTDSLAVFQGACKKCSGYDTIFGKWSFQQNPKDCRQLWTFIETKNDILLKDVLHHPLNSPKQHENSKLNMWIFCWWFIFLTFQPITRTRSRKITAEAPSTTNQGEILKAIVSK